MLLLGSVCLAVSCGCVLLITILNGVQPGAYMDEIFHVNQTAAYCDTNYTYWNPKITTPPGLYVITSAVMRVVAKICGITSVSRICVTRLVRYINPMLMPMFIVTVYLIIRKLRGDRVSESNVCLAAVNCLMLPVLYFMCLLHYTDLPSTMLTLLMYCLHLHNLHIFSALIAAAAVSMRQTNIVWVAFCAGLTVCDSVQEFVNLFEKKQPDLSRSIKSILKGIWRMSREKPTLFWHMILAAFARVAGYVAVIIMCIILAIVNKGVALGDKGAHVIVVHLPQFCYMLAFICFFAFPLLLHKNVCSLIRRNRNRIYILCALFTWCVMYFTYEHPYLLADNRHFTFYVWRWWFRRGILYKYVPVFAYAMCLVIIANSLHHMSSLWRLGYFMSCVLVTVPNKLLEFRYFIIPFLMWRMHCRPSFQTRNRLVVEFLFYAIINLCVYALFLLRPFRWSHESGVQRFMW